MLSDQLKGEHPSEQTEVDLLSGQLKAFLAANIAETRDLEVTNLRRLHSGFSRDNWTLDVTWYGGGEVRTLPLIMRRDPAGSVLQTDREIEFRILRALQQTSLPVPVARWFDDGSRLRAPALLMDRIEGQCDWFPLNGSAPLPSRLELAHSLLATLVSVHSVDWAALDLDFLDDPGPNAAACELTRWSSRLQEVALEPLPELEVVHQWLQRDPPASSRTVLVHGDFKPGNVLLRHGTIVGLLDWETAHLGDPVEDLGWVTNPVRRREHQIPGAWERDALVAEYARLTGHHVSSEQLRWWNVFSCWKSAIIVMTGLRAFVDRRSEQVLQLPTWLVRPMFRMMAGG